MRMFARLNGAIRRGKLFAGGLVAGGGLIAAQVGCQRQQPATAIVSASSTAVCRPMESSGSQPAVEARLVLAPSGKLRVGVFRARLP